MKLIKEKSNFYLIKDDNKIKVELEVVQKYRLYTESDNLDINLIYEENMYHYYYKLALKRLARMQSEYMLRQYLSEKEAPNNIINQVIHSLKLMHYIDDFDYAKNYVELKMNSWGPIKLEQNLLKAGLSRVIIDDVLSKVDEEQILNNLLSKEVRKIKSSFVQFKQKLIRKFYQKGFNIDVVLKVVNEQLDEVVYDETIDLEKEYNKLIARGIRKKQDEQELKYEIRNKLMKKGYRLDDIKKIEER